MKKSKTEKPVLGVGWYKKEQWPLLREKSKDAEELEETYDDWVANSNDTINNLSKSNYYIEKIEIDVEELIEWCKKENCVLNGESRSKYITLKTKEKFK